MFLGKSLGMLAFVLCAVASPSSHGAASDSSQSVTVLDTLVVSGKLPGPGLWKVSQGEHVLWILGTISPLPKRMQWTADKVQATIARSQEVLMPPSVEMKTDVGMLGGLFMLPSLMKARNNPEEQTLSQLLPPETYARWTVLKRRYLGRDRGIEKRRPIIAAQKLQDKALDRNDLSSRNVSLKVVRKAAKKHDVPMTTPTVEVAITDVKGTIRDLATVELDDVECFQRTLEKLESDLETMKLRANAWALGEVRILRDLPYTDNSRACTEALLQNRIAKGQGWDDLETRVRAAWIAAAQRALDKNATSFALLPMGMMLGEDGYLEALKAKGYVVEAPDAKAAVDDGAQAGG